MKNVLKESVESLNFEEKLHKKIKENNISTVEELWSLTRKELKSMSFTDQDIHQIIIRLELHGLDLGKRIVKV